MIPQTLKINPHNDNLGPQILQAIFRVFLLKLRTTNPKISTTACQQVSKITLKMNAHMICICLWLKISFMIFSQQGYLFRKSGFNGFVKCLIIKILKYL